MEKDKDRTIEDTIKRDDFDFGKAGCIEPADLDKSELYTWRRKLPLQQRTDESYAEDIQVRVIKVNPREDYFMLPVECVASSDGTIVSGRPVDCTVALDGMILNDDPTSSDIEQGYFLGGEALPGHESQESIQMARVPARMGRISVESAMQEGYSTWAVSK